MRVHNSLNKLNVCFFYHLCFQAELREQIATQNTEIENLQTEIRSLRQEVENVTMQCVAEREKAEVLQEQVSKDSRKHGSDER